MRKLDRNYSDWKPGDRIVWELKPDMPNPFTIARIEDGKVSWEKPEGTNRTECDNMLRVTGDDDTSYARDTQFQGFAKALWDEIAKMQDAFCEECGTGPRALARDMDRAETLDQSVQTLIARCVYDLACHTIRSQAQGMDLFGLHDPEWMQERVERVPDMTEVKE